MSPNTFALVVTSALVSGLLALMALVWWMLTAQKNYRLRQRLHADGSLDEFATGDGDELLQTVARGGRQIEGWLDAGSENARLLLQAGWRSNRQRRSYYVFQALLPIALAGLAAMVWTIAPGKLQAPVMLLLFSVMGLILGALIPIRLLRRRAAARRRRLKKEMPLFVHLLVLLFEAGLSTKQAIASLVREGNGVLPEIEREFETVLRQLEAGGDTAEVLKNLDRTMEVEDLGSILAVLRQVDRYGGEIRNPLLEALEVMEQRREIDLREQVNLMAGRMTIVMVLFFFPALLIFVAGPAFVSILKMLGQVSG